MNQAQRDYLDSILNKSSGPSIYDEEDDLGKSSANEAQKQLLLQYRKQLDNQDSSKGLGSSALDFFLPPMLQPFGNTLARGSINLYNLTNVSRAERLSELARTQEAREARNAELAAEGGEQSLSSKIFDWSSNNETVEELDALSAKYVKRAYDVNKWKNKLFPMTEAAEQQLNNIIESDTWFGKEGAILQALSDPLATSSAMLQVAGEQMPTIVAVMLAARKSPKAAMAIMGGSSFLQERYGQLLSEAQEAGYDLSDPNQALEAVKDTKFMSDQSKKGFTRGAIIAATDLAFLGLASKAKFNIGGIATQTGVQAIGGGTGEFLAQVATGDEIRPGEILVEGLAEGAMAPADVAAFGLKKASDMRSGGTPPPVNSETRLDGDLAQELAEEEAQLQAANLAEQQKAEVIQQKTDDVVKEARIEAAKSFTPRDTFLNERKKAREADAVNPETEVGKAFKQYKKDLDEYGGSPEADKALLTKFMKSFVPKDDREAGIEEYNAALDAHAAGIANGTITPVSNYDKKTKQAKLETPKKIASDLVAKNSELLTMSEERMRFLIPDEDTYSEVVKLRDKNKPKPETDRIAEQRSYVEEKLGKDWDSKEENAGLVEAFNARTGFYKKDKAGRTSFQNKVDAEIAAREEAAKPKEEVLSPEDKADTTTTEEPNVAGVSDIKGLSKNQQKVFDVLADHFFGDKKFDIDNVYAGGKFQATKIAELAGVNSKQAVSTTINRFRTKIAQEMGIIPADATAEQKKEGLKLITKRLSAIAQARRTPARVADNVATNELADAEGAVNQRPDAYEVTEDDVADNSIFQQQGMSTVDSVGQGNYTGKDISEEDIKYTKERVNEPDAYENKRQELADRQRRDDNNKMFQRYGAEAIAEWNNIKSEGSIEFRKLNPKDMVEWIATVEENRVGELSDAEMQKEQREMEQKYESSTKPAIDEVPADRAITGPESRDTTKQVGTQDNQEAQLKEGDPDSFTAGKDQSGSVKVVKKRRSKLKRSVVSRRDNTTTVDNIKQAAVELFGVTDLINKKGITLKLIPGEMYSSIIVHKTAKDAHQWLWRATFKNNPKTGKYEQKEKYTQKLADKEIGYTLAELEAAQGFIGLEGFTTHLIAENIVEGNEKAVLLHEVGVHLGLEGLLNNTQVSQLYDAVMEWENSPKDSIERQIYEKTMGRVAYARTLGMDVTLVKSETIAYAVEEAVLAGVEPDSQSTSLAARWLDNIKNLFSDLTARLMGQEPQISANELVALAHGAAVGETHNVVTEKGARSTNPEDVIAFYSGLDRYSPLRENAQLMDTEIPGEETFVWGENSTFGDFKGITTTAEMFDVQDMDLPRIFSLEVRADDNVNEPILELTATEKDFDIANRTELINTWDFSVNADIDRGGKTAKGVEGGGDWARLESVRFSELMPLLAEFRRRITRFQRGIVPHVKSIRMTGAAATNWGDRLKKGNFPDDVIRKKFSIKKDGPDLKLEPSRSADVGISQKILDALAWGEMVISERLKNAETKRKRKTFEKTIKQLTGKSKSWRIKIYDTYEDAVAATTASQLVDDATDGVPYEAYAWTSPDSKDTPIVHIILDRIPEGREQGVFMHEVGGHMGIDTFIPLKMQQQIALTINKWASLKDNSTESIIANRVLNRLKTAREVINTKLEGQETNPFDNQGYSASETIAYFLEEATFAGVEPSVKAPVGRLLRKLYAHFRNAIRKLRINSDQVTAQDIVDLGYGAARISLSARKHGTASWFARFSHKFMGTGEGAQAYGWGSYLAERLGIARFYMIKDMLKKQELIDTNLSIQGVPNPENLSLNELPESIQEVILNPNKWGVDLTEFKPSFIDVEPVMGVELDQEVIERENLGRIHLKYDPKTKDFIINYPRSLKIGYRARPVTKDRQGRTLSLRAIIRDHIDGIKFSSPEALADERVLNAVGLFPTGRSAPLDLSKIDPKLNQLLQDVDSLEALASRKIEEFIAANEAKGSIMYVDTDVTNEELLPWDAMIHENRQVRNLIVKKLISLQKTDKRTVADILEHLHTWHVGLIENDYTKIIGRYVVLKQQLKERIAREKNKKRLEEEALASFEFDLPTVTFIEAFSKAGTDPYENWAISDFLNHLNYIASQMLTAETIEYYIDNVNGGTLYEALSSFTSDKMRSSPHLMEKFYEESPDAHMFEASDNYNNSRADKLASMWLDSIGVKGIIYSDNVSRSQDNVEGMSKNVVIFNDKNLIVLGRSYSQDMKLDRLDKLRRQSLTATTTKSDSVKTDLTKIKYGIADDWVEATLGKTTKKAWVDTKEIARKSAASVEFLHQVIRRVKDKVPSLGKWYEGMLAVEATRTEIRKSFESIALRAKKLKGDRLYLVNDFLSKSTFFQKWGYDPEIEGREVKVDPIMARAFARLSTEEQQIVKDVFAHGEKMRLRKIDIAKLAGVEGKFFTDAALQGPYAPLKRFGNYVTVLKSEAMYQAELAKDAEGATKEDRKLYDKLSQDPQHYVVSFFDTLGQAQEFANANPQFRHRSATEKIPAADEGRIANTQVFEKVLGALNAGENSGIDSTARQAFGKMVRDLYFQSLDERSARLSGAKRLNRAGYDKNMMRSFLAHAKAEANLIAQMENAANINKAFIEAGKETAIEGNVRGSEENNAYVLVAKHYKQILKGDESPILDRIAAANSVYMLLTSFGYHVANATQPIMVTITRVAGDFNNYAGAWKGLTKGYGIAMKTVKMSNMETSVNVENAPPEYQKLFKKMGLWQILDVGMEEDLSRFESFNTGYDLLNLAGDGLGTITHKLYQVSRYVEAVNRIASAVSAYDMARKEPSKVRAMNMTAEEYAIAVVEDTQGNFSRLDAPLLIKSLPGAKVITQYRKYQLLMAWHYSSAFKQAFKGESAHTRAAGKRVLLYSLAHAGIFAGSVGMPLASLIFWLSTFLGVGEGDEPEDLERWIKRNIDDGLFGQFLSRGVFGFVGIDLSTKLTQDKIFHPLPYVDFQAGEAGWKEILSGIVGPAGTTTGNFFRAWEYMKQGDGIKTLEYIVPKGVRTMLESYRLATEGYTMRNGDVVVDPREISNWSLFWNALGIPSSEIQNIKWTRGQQYELEQYFSNESGRIRRRYIEAHKARDGAWKAELRNEWRELQKAKDRVRPFFNNAPGVLNRQPLTDLIKSPREQRKRERKTQRRFGN